MAEVIRNRGCHSSRGCPTRLRTIFGALVEKPCQGEPAIRAALGTPDAAQGLCQG
jgi:hypothetical protein